MVTLPDGREFPSFDGEVLAWDPGLYFTPTEERAGYPRTRAVLAAMFEHRPEQFRREYSDALKGSFSIFRAGRRYFDLVRAFADERGWQSLAERTLVAGAKVAPGPADT